MLRLATLSAIETIPDSSRNSLKPIPILVIHQIIAPSPDYNTVYRPAASRFRAPILILPNIRGLQTV